MRKTIITAMLGILLISLTSAIIYSGEEVTIPIDFEIVNCSVINSTENLDGLNLSWYNKNIIISTHPLYKSDNLTISCLVIKNGEVVEEYIGGGGVGSGGGSSCKYNNNYDWECSEWGECVNNERARTCKEKNNCGSTYGRPNITESCLSEPITEPTEPKPEPDDIIITYPKPNGNIYIIIAIILITLLIIVTILIIRRRKKK